MNHLLSDEIEIGISGVRKLTDTLKEHYNYDLSCYAVTSLKRRIVKSIFSNDLGNLDGLVNKLIADKSYFPVFLKDLTVEVTEFFRDPALWRYFRDEIAPALDRNHSRIRIWLPGCSSAEEVLTTAIVLKEAGIYDKTQILATDISPSIIADLHGKSYSNAKLEISQNNYVRFNESETTQFDKYILKDKNGFRFIPELYSNITFEVYDYSDNLKNKGINVVLCRNNFIYFTALYQERLLQMISASLIANGYLAIGNKESISFCKEASKFQLINENEKIYKKITG